jgi:hypothetical protein
MRNAMPKALYLAAGILLFGASGGFATTTFTLKSAGPTNLGGVYTSPYTATITGVNGTVPVICDDFVDDVWVNESWTVTGTSLAQLPYLGASSPVLWDTGATATTQVTDYITAAILAEQLMTLSPSSSQAELLSYAIWDVFDLSASSVLGATTNNTVLNTYLKPAQAQAQALVGTSPTNADLVAATAQFANVMIYTADPKSGGAVTYCPPGDTCKAPQEFLVVNMAEPAAPILLIVDLFGVLSLVWFLRRRQRGMSLS